MRRVLAIVVVGLGLIAAGCGNGGDGTDAAAGDLPMLPGTARGAGGGAGEAADARATSALAPEESDGDDATRQCVAPEGGGEMATCDDTGIAPYQPIEYKLADDIDEGGGEAPAYKVEVDLGEADVQRVADAFGVEGDATEEMGNWSVGNVKAGGSWLHVSSDGSFSYTDEAAQGMAAEADARAAEEAKCSPDGVCSSPTPVTQPVPKNLPTDDDAKDKAADLLADAGAMTGDVSVERSEYAVVVMHRPRLDGALIDGLGSSVAFGDNGVVMFAHGSLATPVRVGNYPLASTQEAFDRANAQMGGGSAVAVDSAVAPAETDAAPAADSDAGDSGGADPDVRTAEEPSTQETLPPKVIELTTVELVYIVEYGRCPGDTIYIVPAYRFGTDDPNEFGFGPVPAVTDDYLVSAQAANGSEEASGSGGDDTASYEPCPGVGAPTEPAREPDAPDASGGGTSGSSGSSGPSGGSAGYPEVTTEG